MKCVPDFRLTLSGDLLEAKASAKSRLSPVQRRIRNNSVNLRDGVPNSTDGAGGCAGEEARWGP